MTYKNIITDLSTKETVYEIVSDRQLSLSDALDLVAPDDWNAQVNKYGYFSDGENEIYYDDLDLIVR